MKGEGPIATVRPASPDDAEALARMRLTLQEHMQSSNHYLLPMSHQTRANLATEYRRRLLDPNRRIVVAEDQSGLLIGMAMGTVADRDDLDPPRCGRVDDVWVEPEYRRQGLGRQLMTHLLVFFESEAVKTLVLDYSVGNVEADRTWKALGFEPILTVGVTKPEELRRRLENK